VSGGRRALAQCLTVIVPVAVALSAAAPPAGGSTSPATEYKAALRAAAAESVHFVSKATDGGVELEAVGDTGKSAGSQVLVVQSGNTVETLEIVLIGSTGYIRGNATALQKVVGLTAAQSTAFAGSWLSFPSGVADLADLVGGLRNRDVASELTMTGPYTLGATKKIGGHDTQGINGFAGTSTGGKEAVELFVETGGTPRPVQEVTRAGAKSSDITGTVTFSKWGEKNHIKAPPHPYSLASLYPPSG
jgi:hypothetical protein